MQPLQLLLHGEIAFYTRSKLELKLSQKDPLGVPFIFESNPWDFPDNTNNNFTARLPQKLVLEPGQWEVGAMVVHIPNKFYNIVAGEVAFLSHTTRVSRHTG